MYLQPVLNPKSYDGARVLEASGRPMLVIGRSYTVVSIQDEDVNAEAGIKLAEETTEKSLVTGTTTGAEPEAGAGTEAEKEREAEIKLETGSVTGAGVVTGGVVVVTGEVVFCFELFSCQFRES